MSICKVKRALISVSDKTNIVDFAKKLTQLGIEIISTGGTYHLLKKNNIPAIYISDVTQFPEMLDGRVKTLHPAIHGAILAKRDKTDHLTSINDAKIQLIDLVVVNLYPFQQIAKNPHSAWSELIEHIDIGGPAMIRSAAKNHQDVAVVTDPNDYVSIVQELEEQGECLSQTRVKLAIKAFELTSRYDQNIAKTLQHRTNKIPPTCLASIEKISDLRYGENPHQAAALYRKQSKMPSFIDSIQLNGKALSYNNWLDSDGAFRLIQEFIQPAVIIVKHTNPCGAAIANTVNEAFEKAYQCDPTSAFGGIVAVNRLVDTSLAKVLSHTFWEVIIAPEFSASALAILTEKKNLRLLQVPDKAWIRQPEKEYRSIVGGYLIQDRDCNDINITDWQTVSQKKVTPSQLSDYEFAWKVVKHVKSNAIVVVKNGTTLGIGAGQMNRVGAVNIALQQAGEYAQGAILASDAFFPFKDSVELAARYHIMGIIQPGGSIRDEESLIAANQFGMVMIYTGQRHFRH